MYTAKHQHNGGHLLQSGPALQSLPAIVSIWTLSKWSTPRIIMLSGGGGQGGAIIEISLLSHLEMYPNSC